MKCRLNPNITEFFKALGGFILIALAGIAIFSLISSLFAFIIYCSIKTFELYGLAAYFMPTEYQEFLTLNDYIIACSMNGAMHIWGGLIIGLLVIGFTYGLYSETKESYRWRAHDLKYKFEGIEQPWYRVLLSYIIVCDKTK